MPNVVTPIIGVALSDVSTSPSFNVGTTVLLDDGGQAVYVQAASAISQYNAVLIPNTFIATNATSARSAATKRVGFAQVSIASASYGWVQTGGKVRVMVNTSCNPSVPLYTTATEGVLDDLTVSGALVAGVVTETTASATSAMTAVAAFSQIVSGTIGGLP